MKTNKITISGTGCALADFLFNGISFSSPAFRKYLSKKTGDGGLSPGKLVFTEELEKFSGIPYNEILNEITCNRLPDAFNVGGPSLVSLIHASQMLDPKNYSVNFYGMTGSDDTSGKIRSLLGSTPLCTDNYLSTDRLATPFTDVFSDSQYDGGHGERTFINNIGAAWEYTPDLLDSSFFESDIVCFGGTALVPQIHDNLTGLLSMARRNNCITLVNTVFDFRNEKKSPGSNWPLLDSIGNYDLIDILIMDCEEALRISGSKSINSAADFFASIGVSSFLITNGANDLYAKSNGKLFKETGILKLPVSEKVKQQLLASSEIKGDTTGCGDNFVGGIISSLAWQMKDKQKSNLDFIDAISWAVASGGFTCFIVGGTYHQEHPGDKLNKVAEIQKAYRIQIGE
jgi:sugar/nucleoside kinase (ribokinase family)